MYDPHPEHAVNCACAICFSEGEGASTVRHPSMTEVRAAALADHQKEN